MANAVDMLAKLINVKTPLLSLSDSRRLDLVQLDQHAVELAVDFVDVFENELEFRVPHVAIW